MKNIAYIKWRKVLLTVFFTLLNFNCFSQVPGGGDGDLESTDPVYGIEDHLWILVVMGIIFVFLFLQRKSTTETLK